MTLLFPMPTIRARHNWARVNHDTSFVAKILVWLFFFIRKRKQRADVTFGYGSAGSFMVTWDMTGLYQKAGRACVCLEDEMDVKDAVQVAKNYIMDLFGEEGLVDVGLEEVDVDPSGNWIVTIGFSRSWDRNIGSVLSGAASRSYKAVRIQDEDGRVLSVKDRTLFGDMRP